ncbi:DNA alkylation repair protein [Candidatus Micrarchaeota archaeon]|nr:DNA alkylation repair protein [Candidatus Micrarchaeota archaeon]
MDGKIKEILKELKNKGSEKNKQGMKRFGINVETAFGTNVYLTRKIAKKYKKEHSLALELWKTNIHEARMLAGFIDDPKKVSEQQMELWVKDFNSWDLCDQVCSNLFDKTAFAWKKAVEWTERKKEFEKRAGFVLMCALAVHDKKAKDKEFEKFFSLIKKHSVDERNFVKKAVNWALRQIGKRNKKLNRKCISLAKEIKKIDSKSAKWIASDTLRELESEKVQERLKE